MDNMRGGACISQYSMSTDRRAVVANSLPQSCQSHFLSKVNDEGFPSNCCSSTGDAATPPIAAASRQRRPKRAMRVTRERRGIVDVEGRSQGGRECSEPTTVMTSMAGVGATCLLETAGFTWQAAAAETACAWGWRRRRHCLPCVDQFRGSSQRRPRCARCSFTPSPSCS